MTGFTKLIAGFGGVGRTGDNTGIWLNLAIMGSILVAALVVSTSELNHDTSWYFIAIRRWLEGGILYQDIFEINPPLVFYITAPAIHLGDTFGLADNLAMAAYLLPLTAISLLWIKRLIRRIDDLGTIDRIIFFIACLMGLVVLPMPVFGQREHMAMIFALPFLVFQATLQSAGKISRAEEIALASIAFLGLGLKPYFMLAPLMIALAIAWRGKSWRALFTAGNITIAALGLAYVGTAFIIYPQYFDTIIPLVSLVYFGFDSSLAQVFFDFRFILFLVVCVTSWLVFRSQMMDRPAALLLAGSLGFALSYMVQFKSWLYQSLPLGILLLVTLGWLGPLVWRKRESGSLLHLVAPLAAILLVAHTVRAGTYDKRYKQHIFGDFMSETKDITLLIMSTNVSISFPFANRTGGHWASRYPAQWILPGATIGLARTDCAQKPELCGKYRDALDYARRTMVDDLARFAPDLVLIDVREDIPYFRGLPFDFVEFYRRDPRFAGLWQHYQHTGDRYFFQVWERVSAED